MTEIQKRKLALEKRQSEIRARLGAIALLEGDALTEEIRSERDNIATELRESEPQLQAAIAAVETEEDQRTIDDGEGAEIRALHGRVSLGRYVAAAVEMRAADGVEAEYNSALGIAGNRFPLELLAPVLERVEDRAKTDTDIATAPRRWLDRLFAGTAATALGITMESVPAGSASFPLTTAGASAAQRGREEAAADAAWTVGVSELKPTRNAVRMRFTVEDAARLPGLEAALTRDLRMALTEGVDRAIFIGDSGANENSADIAGLTTAGITETTLTQANKLKGPNTLAAFTAMVDGLHAMGLGDLRIVAAIGAWRLWESTIVNAAADNLTLAAFLRAAGLSWSSRGEIEDATANGDFAAFVGRGRGIEGAGVAAVWEAGELIRDPYSGAAKGEVAITLSYLWNFGLPRPASFARLKFVA